MKYFKRFTWNVFLTFTTVLCKQIARDFFITTLTGLWWRSTVCDYRTLIWSSTLGVPWKFCRIVDHCLWTLLRWLCTVFCRICTYLIHPFRVTGSTNSLYASIYDFSVDFWQILKAWLNRVVLADVNSKDISGSIFETNEWWCLVLVLSFHTCKVMIIYTPLMQTQLIFVLPVKYLLFSGITC